MDQETRAYLAGYFDGEGSVTSVWSTSSARPLPAVKICYTQRDRAALERIQEELGLGTLYLQRSTGGWHLQIAQREEVLAFVRLVYPFVRQKRVQLRIAYRMALLVGRRPITEFDRERRTALWDELRAANLLNRTAGVANRHGGNRLAQVVSL